MRQIIQQKQQQSAHPQPREHVVVVVLSDHLDRSSRLLVELKHADAENTEMVVRGDEARSLLTANRICLKNSKQDDDPALATALNRLDHLFGELADQPGGPSAATLTQLQKEMNADGILFEVRVLRSESGSKHPGRAVERKHNMKIGIVFHSALCGALLVFACRQSCPDDSGAEFYGGRCAGWVGGRPCRGQHS